MLRNWFTRQNAQPSAPAPAPASQTYADVVEVMRYDRASDVMPFAVACRPKPPHVGAWGSEPYFALLDSEAEVAAFMEALNRPLVFELSGKVAMAPLHRWNGKPTTLMADVSITAFYYPDDESQGWPFMQLLAASPAMLASSVYRPEDIVRGRYAVRQFHPSEKQRLVDELMASQAAGPRIFVNGKLPSGMASVLNPRKGRTQ